MPAADPTYQLNKLLDGARYSRLPVEREWWLNLAFYLDYQYVQWSPELNTIERIPVRKGYENVPRQVVNKINPFIQQALAFSLENRPGPDVLPPNDDPITYSNSQVALAYASWAAGPQQANNDKQQSMGALWALICGTAFFRWFWDPKLQAPRFRAVSPFDIFIDPYATEFDDARYVIHSQYMDREAVYDAYGIQPTGPSETPDAKKVRLLRELGAAPVLDGITVSEIWMKPSRRHPNGLHAIWSGKQLFVEPSEKGLPYNHCREYNRLPYTQIGVVPRPGSVYYDSHVKYLRKPQMELNKYHSQRIMIRENYASPKWGIPREIQIDEDPTPSPNQILRYDASEGLKPEIFQPAAMADNNEGEWITSEMMNVVGQHEVSQGQVPGRVESSKAIEILKESDASRLKVLIDTINQSISEGYWQVCMLGKQYEKPEKLITIYGPDTEVEVKRFLSSKFDPGTKFRVTTNTGLAWSRAGRADQITRLVELGIIPDPGMALKLLDIGAPIQLDPTARDSRLARNENYLFQSARQAIVPNSWDNHEIHIKEHNEFRKTHEYTMLPDEVKQKIEFHVEKHKDLLTEAINEQVELQALAQGAALQQGAPSGGQGTPGNVPQPAPAAPPPEE